MATVVFRGTRAEAIGIIRQAVAILGGSQPDRRGLGRSFWLSLGFGALSDISTAFIAKSRGGTDEAGIRWPELKPETVAARRVGPGDRSGDSLIRRRETVRKRETAKALRRFLLVLPAGEARRRAAIVGGQKATQETHFTKTETLGDRSVETLRDTGILFNSLSPGEFQTNGTNGSYQKPSGDGGEQQIFDARRAEIIVGTNVPYASTHQNGSASRNIPARPFLPPDNQVPRIWWSRWIDIAATSLVSGLRTILTRGGF